MADNENYVVIIEIDVDAGDVTLVKGDYTEYKYRIEELEGKGVIDNALAGGAELTVYSQGERLTKEEFEALFGDQEPDYLRY